MITSELMKPPLTKYGSAMSSKSTSAAVSITLLGRGRTTERVTRSSSRTS